MRKTLDKIAFEIDEAADKKNMESLIALLQICSSEIKNSNCHDRVIYHFFKANCYSAIHEAKSLTSGSDFEWRHKDKVSEIISLREAVSDSGFHDIDEVLKCKILTNLGNNLNNLGRFVEALSYWNMAISIIPNFAMALGNKGIGLTYYSRYLYDHGHSGILLAFAKDSLSKVFTNALWDSGFQSVAHDSFKSYYDDIANHLDRIEYDFYLNLSQEPLAKNKKEAEYRKWCLDNTLFLSPLNDVCKEAIAARDVFHLPTHSYGVKEEPRFPKYFNVLKQEYATARFMLFDSVMGSNNHFSDNDVLLLDNYDAAEFGYKNEQLKTAFRISYSLFDKIALFINDYFNVGLVAGKVSFRKIWGEKTKQGYRIRPCFDGRKNWPLRGLYYLSKDLFDKDFNYTALPEAKELADLRNNLEHRFVSVQWYASQVPSTNMHTYIIKDDLEKKTLKIMFMAREALIYLSLAMHLEEINKPDDGSLAVPIVPSPIDRQV